MTSRLSGLVHQDWTSWLGREPWSTLFAGFGGAVVASLVVFLAAVWVLRRTLAADRAEAERRHTVALQAIEQQTAALAEAQRRERLIAAAAQLTSGWVTPGWEWVALGPTMVHGLAERRRYELVRRWLADGSRLAMNLVDDELDIYQAVQRTTAVLNDLLGPKASGPEVYIETARTFSRAIHDWVRGDLSVWEASAAILAEVQRFD